MNRITLKRSLIALTILLTLTLGSAPAYAASYTTTSAPVPSHALVGGTDLYGMNGTVAAAAIASASVVPSIAPITVKGDGRSMVFSANSAIYLNVNAMLSRAYTATDTATPFELAPVISVRSSVVKSWVAKFAKKVDHKATDAKRRVKSRKLVVSAEKSGHAVNKKVTAARITAAIISELKSPSAEPVVVSAALTTLKPKVTRKNIGKAILVVLSKFSVNLYSGTKIEKSYKCATGMPGHATPTGTWKVTGKVKNPSWHNPGSAWGAGMPSVIGPGPTNPLGTRAIYLNASGIRIHGTSKYYSIGHRASHGCMRMRRHDIEDLYPRVPVGITVYIVK